MRHGRQLWGWGVVGAVLDPGRPALSVAIRQGGLRIAGLVNFALGGYLRGGGVQVVNVREGVSERWASFGGVFFMQLPVCVIGGGLNLVVQMMSIPPTKRLVSCRARITSLWVRPANGFPFVATGEEG